MQHQISEREIKQTSETKTKEIRINKAMSGKYEKNSMRINKTSTSET